MSRKKSTLRITKVYTRTGDKGTTRLVGGQMLKKHHPRIESYGTVDELSVAMGRAREALANTLETLKTRKVKGSKKTMSRDLKLLGDHLIYLQNLLFTLGGDLATCIQDRWENMPLIQARDVTDLEKLIDAYNASLPALTDFVLPGGGELALALHQCRVVCRRAERRIQSLADLEPVGDSVIPFVNRLSDLFFVLGRWAAAQAAKAGLADGETIWRRDLKRPPLPG